LVTLVQCAGEPTASTKGSEDASAGLDGSEGPSIDRPESGVPSAAEIRINVRSDANVHLISPLIYGINGARDLTNNRQTLARSGGNRLTAYNWENNASNAGSDWHFQNDDYLSKSDEPAKAVTDLIDQDSAANVATLVTVPVVDYVAADKNGNGDVRNSGADYLDTRFKRNVAEKNCDRDGEHRAYKLVHESRGLFAHRHSR
jgi:hypothetical protein